MKGRILLIDDQPEELFLYSHLLSGEEFEVQECSSARKALSALKKEPSDVIVCDVNLADAHALDLISQFKKLVPWAEVIMLTAYAKVQDGVQAIKSGAFDYLMKGDDTQQLIPLIYRGLEKASENRKKQERETDTDNDRSFETVIGGSEAIQQLVSMSRRVAPTDTSVLLLGETGTGKEVFARAIHRASKRYQNPFVAVNCSAFNKELLESELFGHVAGAFTGAVSTKKGLFEVADGGTLFLDEIGEMHPDLQAKLLRVLESGTFLRVGDTREQKVNVRIIAATNKQLLQDNSGFRSDLYYRLSVFTLELPPLRERKEDIPALVAHFMENQVKKRNMDPLEVNPEFMETLMNYSWKGNVRELRNTIERAVILTDGNRLDEEALPAEIRFGGSVSDWTVRNDCYDLEQVEKQHILRVLKIAKGNKTKAARMLNIGISTLYRKLAELEE